LKNYYDNSKVYLGEKDVAPKLDEFL